MLDINSQIYDVILTPLILSRLPPEIRLLVNSETRVGAVSVLHHAVTSLCFQKPAGQPQYCGSNSKKATENMGICHAHWEPGDPMVYKGKHPSSTLPPSVFPEEIPNS